MADLRTRERHQNRRLPMHRGWGENCDRHGRHVPRDRSRHVMNQYGLPAWDAARCPDRDGESLGSCLGRTQKDCYPAVPGADPASL